MTLARPRLEEPSPHVLGADPSADPLETQNHQADTAETGCWSIVSGEITLKQLTKLLVQNELEDYDPVKEAFKASAQKKYRNIVVAAGCSFVL